MSPLKCFELYPYDYALFCLFSFNLKKLKLNQVCHIKFHCSGFRSPLYSKVWLGKAILNFQDQELHELGNSKPEFFHVETRLWQRKVKREKGEYKCIKLIFYTVTKTQINTITMCSSASWNSQTARSLSKATPASWALTAARTQQGTTEGRLP